MSSAERSAAGSPAASSARSSLASPGSPTSIAGGDSSGSSHRDDGAHPPDLNDTNSPSNPVADAAMPHHDDVSDGESDGGYSSDSSYSIPPTSSAATDSPRSNHDVDSQKAAPSAPPPQQRREDMLPAEYHPVPLKPGWSKATTSVSLPQSLRATSSAVSRPASSASLSTLQRVQQNQPLLATRLARRGESAATYVSPMARLAAREQRKQSQSISANAEVGATPTANLRRFTEGAIVRGSFARARRDSPLVFRDGAKVVALARPSAGPPAAGPGGDDVASPSPTASPQRFAQHNSSSAAGTDMQASIGSAGTVSQHHHQRQKPRKAQVIAAMVEERKRLRPGAHAAPFSTSVAHPEDANVRARAAFPAPDAYDAADAWARTRPASRGGVIPRAGRPVGSDPAERLRVKERQESAAAAHRAVSSMAGRVNRSLAAGAASPADATSTGGGDVTSTSVVLRGAQVKGPRGMATVTRSNLADRVRSSERGRPGFR